MSWLPMKLQPLTTSEKMEWESNEQGSLIFIQIMQEINKKYGESEMRTNESRWTLSHTILLDSNLIRDYLSCQ